MYKEGMRWTEYMESESVGKHDIKYMVLDHILTISMIQSSLIIHYDEDHNHYISGTWSHEHQQGGPTRQHVHAQNE